jgi:hypothetical protein
MPDGGDEPFALPPTEVFGFHRQADGSFAEPFPVGFDDEGFWLQPASFSFTSASDPSGAGVVFEYERLTGSTKAVEWTSVVLGAPATLGRYSCYAGVLTLSDATSQLLPIEPTAQQPSNVAYAQGRLWVDGPDGGLAWASVSGALPDAGLGAWNGVGLATSAGTYQAPMQDGSRLYYVANDYSIRSSPLTGMDPSSPASWGAEQIELAPEMVTTGIPLIRPGTIVALGQPTVAHPDGGPPELYFVYVVKSATGLDGQVGRARHR